MKINEFVENISLDLLKFKSMWEKGQKENPKGFPAEMELVDWVDQFVIFSETEET